MGGFLELIGVENTEQIISCVVRLVVAAVCGALIGIDRERRRRPAGLRTHMLVCVGAALVMITAEQIQHSYPGGDITRMGAQVISGIGFLGAGTILVDRRNRVRGLTTAAGLWTSACIGLAIGSGFYVGGLFACLLTILIVAVFFGVERRFSKKARTSDFYVEFKSAQALYSFISHTVGMEYKIVEFRAVEPESADCENAAAEITFELPFSEKPSSLIAQLHDLEGLVGIREK